MKAIRFIIHLYPQRQRIPLIFPALPQGLFSAEIDAGVSHDSDIGQHCETLAQHVMYQREQSLAREFLHRDQKPGEDGEE